VVPNEISLRVGLRWSLQPFSFAPLTTVDPYEATNPATYNEVRLATSILGKLHAGLNKTSPPRRTTPAIALWGPRRGAAPPCVRRNIRLCSRA
jgi:hypothetical protein